MMHFLHRVFKLAPFCKVTKNVYSKYVWSRSWASARSCTTYIYTSPYTPEEQSKILQKINDSTEEDLSRYAISKARAKNLVKFKQKSGHFKSLDEILQVDSLGVKVVEKLYASILKGDTKSESEVKEKSKNKAIKRLVTPSIDKSYLQEVDSIVGIHINVNALSVAQVNLKAELLTWDVLGLDTQKLHITAIFKIVQDLVSILPTADIYVMEDIQRLGSLSQKHSAVIKQNNIFSAILMALLNVCKSVESETKVPNSRVLFLRPMLPARLFQTIVGGERVSAQAIVSEILQESPTSDTGMKIGYTPISVNLDLKQKYLASNSADREHYCQCLLLAMTFLDLIVYENTTCLSCVR